MTRTFYRCRDCLSVATVSGTLNRPSCGLCGGEMELIGMTKLGLVAGTALATACDGRCTGAKGPACDCACNGENHGSARHVTTATKADGTSIICVRPDAIAAKIAAEWRLAYSSTKGALKSLPGYGEFEAGRRIEPAQYAAIRRRVTAINKAYKSRSHTARMRFISNLL